MCDNNNPTTQSIADYLAQLLKDRKQLAAFPNVFMHIERLLDEGRLIYSHLARILLIWELSAPEGPVGLVRLWRNIPPRRAPALAARTVNSVASRLRSTLGSSKSRAQARAETLDKT